MCYNVYINKREVIDINIVLEGPKACGKGRIASYFKNEGYEYFHSDSNSENDLNYHMNLLSGNKRIIDRFSLGEMIYPIVFDRDGKLNIFEFLETISDKNTLYIIMYASDYRLLIDRIDYRNREKEDFNIYGQVIESNRYFEKLAKTLNNFNNVLVFDVCKTNSENIIKIIKEQVDKK